MATPVTPGSEHGLPLVGARVAQAILKRPKVHGPATTVREIRDLFADEHVHVALIVTGRLLLAVVERSDLAAASSTAATDDAPARLLGQLSGRVVRPDADLGATWREMVEQRRRRLAVLDDDGGLVGLLCLKRSQRGFCSDIDVRDRDVRDRDARDRACARPLAAGLWS